LFARTHAGEAQLTQEAGAFCAVHAVNNGLQLGPFLQDIKVACGPQAELKEIRVHLDRAKRPPCKLRATAAASRLDLLPWLQRQMDDAAFAVEFEVPDGLHVVTWVTATDGAATIYETDPTWPHVLPATGQVLDELGITKGRVRTVLKIEPSLKAARRSSASSCSSAARRLN
jgi:hypothetical protein